MMSKLLIIIEQYIMNDWRAPIHPGEILMDELDEIDITPEKLAREIGLPESRIYQLLNGKRRMTADIALRLGKFFNTGPEVWLNLQKAYDLEVARQKISHKLEAITPYQAKVPALVLMTANGL